ncbi:CHAP domain-containing protein [Paenarthrobacter sp. GOM3]|uniref:CHAP domain-containing protein n=1 Tax=Paenarthrobacter sp. GOM3 TaxID=2782567 RepID=UPI001BA4CC30|nr:CHAP domain-containing protein [Paenarthrobacter sp. GOM3]WOH20116.1 CHAP domain-containing protein [Paenarthrobacter sp. GOM3]
MSILYEWAASVINKSLDPDGHFGNQCVDTIDHFGEFIFGVPWSQCVGGVAGAKSLLDVAPDKYWDRIDYYPGFIPQQFDVLVWRGDYLNQWGHTAVCWWANASTINVIQQDGFARPWKFVDGNWYSDKPAHYYTLGYSQTGTGPLAGVLRPKASQLRQGSGDIVLSGEIIEPPEGDLDMAGAADVIKYLQDIFFGTYKLGGRDDNPGLAFVLVENQKRIDTANAKIDRLTNLVTALPANIWWNVTVEREDAQGRKIKIPALQELANIRTGQGQDRETLLEIAGKTGAQAEIQLQQVFSELANRIDPEEVKEDQPNG